MSSSGTKKAKKTSAAKGKKASKRVVTPVEADAVPVAEVPEVQVSDQEAPATDAAPDREPKPAKGRRGARVATSGATDATPAAKPLSCLDAAATVLADCGVPMRCKDLIDVMASAGLWSSTAPTPAATLYSALLREISTKGATSRFKKTDRGHFALNQ